jgi:hypothetical protein
MPAARKISQTVDGATGTPSLVSSPWIRRWPPQRILLRQADDEPGDARDRGRAAGLAPLARVVLLRGQPAMPGQERRRCHREDFGPAVTRYEPSQRGEPDPVGRLVTYRAGVAAQHRVLVPEYQQLGILRQVRTEHLDGQAENPANYQVDDLERHPASQPCKRRACWRPKVGHSIDYSSGTGCSSLAAARPPVDLVRSHSPGVRAAWTGPA